MRGLLCALTFFFAAATLCAAEPATKPPELKDYNGYFPWTPPADKATWEKRRVELLRQLQLAVGLYPMPERSAPPKAT